MGTEIHCGHEYSQHEADEYDARLRAQLVAKSNEALRRYQEEGPLDTTTEPVERLLRGAAHYVEVNDQMVELEGGRRGTRPLAGGSSLLLLGGLCPEALSRSWDDRSVAYWFAEEARRRQLPVDRVQSWADPAVGRSHRRRRTHVETRRGPEVGVWVLPQLLLEPLTVMDSPDGLIAVDGRLDVGWKRDLSRANREIAPARRLSLAALVFLASRLGFAVRWRSDLVRLPQPR